MEDLRRQLNLPQEPTKLRAETRALVEDSPAEGTHLVSEGLLLVDLLWEEWGAELEGAGMSYESFLQINRGYAGEIWLWVMGERPWDHCIAGLAGRVLRRLPRQQRRGQEEPALASCGGRG